MGITKVLIKKEFKEQIPFKNKQVNININDIQNVEELSCVIECEKFVGDLDNILYNLKINNLERCKWLSIAKKLNCKIKNFVYVFQKGKEEIYKWGDKSKIFLDCIPLCKNGDHKSLYYYHKCREAIMNKYADKDIKIYNEDSSYKYGLHIIINSDESISETNHIKPIIDGFTAALQSPVHLFFVSSNANVLIKKDIKLCSEVCNMLEYPNPYVFKNSKDYKMKLNPRDDFYYEIIVEKGTNTGCVGIKLLELHDE